MELCASRPVLGFRTGGRTHNHILALGNVLPLADQRRGHFALHIPAVLEAPLAHFHTHALHQHPPDSRRLVTEFGALACYGSLDHKQNSRKPLPPALRQQWSDLVVALRARSAAAANCTGGSAQLALLADLLMLAGARCRLPNPASSMDHVARYIAEARARPQS